MKELLTKRMDELNKEFDVLREAIIRAEKKMLMLQGGYAELSSMLDKIESATPETEG